MLDILYLSVAILTVYVGLVYLRRAGAAQRTYAWLLLVDGALAGTAAYLGRTSANYGALGDLAGAISLFGFVGLVLLPPFLKFWTRRALAHEQDGLALWLTGVREILAPGLGARQEREMIEAARAVRAGDTDALLGRLQTRRGITTDARERQAIEDRMVLILLGAARWREAVELFTSRSDDGIRPGQLPILVEIVHAYGELGDLEGAARLLAFLERLPGAGEPALSPHLARARLLFLAFAGRPAAVETILAAQERSLPPDARAYWLGVARLYAGDADGARASLTDAVRRARDRRRRAAAEERLASVGSGVTPRALSADLAAFADEVAAHALAAAAESPPILEGLHAGATPVTWAIIAANVAVYLLVVFLFHSTTDAWVVARVGANFGPAVDAGEWWRLVACAFLHAGALHIGVNMLGVWNIGRIVEQMLGPLRFGAIYTVAAIGGSLASHFFSHTLSVGASGGVMGIVGAAIVELVLRRKRKGALPGLLNYLVFITIAMLGVGFASPMIDQSAHIGGLVCGGLATLLLSPRRSLGAGAFGRWLAIVICGGGLAAAALTVWGVATSPYARTVERIGWRPVAVDGVAFDVPRHWEAAGGDFVDPMLALDASVKVLPAADLGAIEQAVQEELAKTSNVSAIEPVTPLLVAPPGWTLRELRFVATMDRTEVVFRDGTFLRLAGRQTLLVHVQVPEPAAAEAVAVVERVVASARP